MKKKRQELKDRRERESIHKIDRVWPDSDVYILGGGPSLNNANLDLIHDKHVIGVNNAYTLGDWVDVCWFGDARWYGWHCEALKSFKGMIYHCANRIKGQRIDRVKRVGRGKSQGLDRRPEYVAWNRSSGASAINLAYHLGAKRIILLGFDMRKRIVDGEERQNWHKDHKVVGAKANPYPRFLQVFRLINIDAKKLGVEILNATPNSSIKDFPIVDLESVV